MEIRIAVSDEEIRKLILDTIRTQLYQRNEYSELDIDNLELINDISCETISELTAYYNYNLNKEDKQK